MKILDIDLDRKKTSGSIDLDNSQLSDANTKLKHPIKILIIIPGYIPSVTIGVLAPLIELEKQGYVKLKLFYSGNFSFSFKSLLFSWCDVAVFCRNSELHDLAYLYSLKQKGKKVIFEIDDNFFDISLYNKVGIYHRKVSRLHVIKKFFILSDLTRVYSKILYSIAKSFGANVELKKLYFRLALVNNLPKPAKNKKILMAYPTTRIDDPKLEKMFFQALQNVLNKYKSKVELHLWSKSIPQLLMNCPNVILNKGVSNYNEFIESFYSTGFSVRTQWS